MLRLMRVIFIIVVFIGCVSRDRHEAAGEIPAPVVAENDLSIVPVSINAAWWRTRHNDRKTIIRNQKIIFIGDSITHFWEGTDAWDSLNKEHDNKITNLGFAGDQTQHVLWRLENGEFPPGINPEYVVLMIGTNNMYDSGRAPASTAAGIGKIVTTININSPSTKIILLAILPRGIGANDELTKKNNAVNEIIKKYDGYLNVEYHDLGQYYVNNDGTLKVELFTDRLHLTSLGYDVWADKLREIIK